MTDQNINVSIASPEEINVTIDKTIIAGTFLNLSDAPNSYSGEGLKLVRVNNDEDALEFTPSTVIWGTINGTLSDQTDLQSALDLKYDAADYNTDWDTKLATKNTDNLSEGSSNFYDKTVVFTGGTNVTIGGTYPDFTITDNSGTSDLALGETDSTAYRGDRGKAGYDHSLVTSGNPHSVTASEINLGNVTNVSTDDTAYNATSWDANTDASTKNAIRDKVETMDTAIGLNTSKVTNATHTGDVTGATVLTIGADKVNDTHIDFGTGANQVSTADIPEQTNLYYTEGRVIANTDVSANTTHRTSDGTDHTYIDQDVTTTSSPTFDDIKVSDKVYLDFASNTYFKYNSGTGEVELYVGGNIKASW